MNPKYTPKFDCTRMFASWREIITCIGKKPEYVLFTRIGRGTKRFLVNNVRWGSLMSDSSLESGDICQRSNGDTLFLVAKTNSFNGDKGEFYTTNTTVNLYKVSNQLDEYGNTAGTSVEKTAENIKCVYEDVSAKMHLFDYGLLPTTTKRFILPKDTKVALLDRIESNGQLLQIDVINKFDFAPFLYVQCSPDERG
jgi:hypothetical protein|nr:MAG TPA: protein of unknown function DUF3599 [Caudoviricetes sp.]